MLTSADYEDAFLALDVCINARVPVVLWGPPGQGKTSVVRDLAKSSGRHLEILLASIREPQDFGGLPTVSESTMSLIPPGWATRLAADGNGILFIDEVNTAPPAVQAALLRVCLDKVAGDCELGQQTSVIAAANPPEQAADGWDLAPALANRFCHIEWSLPTDVVRDGLAGNWPSYQIPTVPLESVGDVISQERILVAGFLSSRPDLTTALPKQASEQGRAFPTPRSWEMAADLSAWCEALKLGESVRRVLVRGTVGQGAAVEYLTYRDNMDLPNPNDVLANPESFPLPTRTDLIYVIGAGALAIVRAKMTNENWAAFGKVLERFATGGHPDIAISMAREWLRIRPAKTVPDKSMLKSLVPLMKEAKLL